MKTRREQIEAAAQENDLDEEGHNSDICYGFEKGAEWADQNPVYEDFGGIRVYPLEELKKLYPQYDQELEAKLAIANKKLALAVEALKGYAEADDENEPITWAAKKALAKIEEMS